MAYHIDHIDPRWEEGRDYQLVCGFSTLLNFEERDASFNVSKGNRFLPWRIVRDEIGGVPRHPGDLCQFLDIDTGEWVLEEFLGEWWFKKSQQTDARCVTKIGKKRPDLSIRNRASVGVKRGPPSSSHRANLSKALKGKPKSDEACANMSTAAILRCNRARCRRMAMSDPLMPCFDD